MEELKTEHSYKRALIIFIFSTIILVFFSFGFAWSRFANAEEASEVLEKKPRVIYPKKTELDFEGINIEGEVRNPGEFYFQHRKEEKFDSLVKRRKDFHREMLRDVVLSK